MARSRRSLVSALRRAAFAALAFGVVGSAAPDAASADPLIHKGKFAATEEVFKLTEKIARERDACAQRIEGEELPWSVDCNEKPTALGGAGTGDPQVDARLVRAFDSHSNRYLKLRRKGTPSEWGIDVLCSPPTDDWDELDVCAVDLAEQASIDLFNLRWNPTVRTVGDLESRCRRTLGRKIPNAFRRILRARSQCFVKNGLNEAGDDLGDKFSCRAPAVPPGLGRPFSENTQLDNRIETIRNTAYRTVYNNCPDYLGGSAFPGPLLSDPTGDVFVRMDLVQIYISETTRLADEILDRIYPGVAYCGDGNVDAFQSEQCDDGNRINCDGCDANCTNALCGNAVACASDGETCDDGNASSEDGCAPLCIAEYCGDNSVQGDLDEECDDGDFDDDDGCDSNCRPTACGNGFKSDDEECDNGENNSDIQPNACRTDCTLPICGDGVADSGEQCDTVVESATCNFDCTNAECGDGYVNLPAGETCDDGDGENEDDCPDGIGGTCQPARCGDGHIFDRFEPSPTTTTTTLVAPNPDELCDDGNESSNDGCDSLCQFEDGWNCNLAEPTVCTSICGDGLVVGDEECDDGNPTDGDGCDSNCRTTGCGNGVTTAGETCDDGNGSNLDGCPDGIGGTCQTAFCGDGFTRTGFEDCDHAGESPVCTADCTVSFCGDGIENASSGEECDDGGGNNDSVPNACRTDCTAPGCGDGVTDSGEFCDDGGESASCDSDCTEAECGDANTNAAAGETCDDGNGDNGDACPDGVGGTCVDATCGDGHTELGVDECDHAGESSLCDTDCTFVSCGDGQPNATAGETCDDGNNANDDACPDGPGGSCKTAVCGDGHTFTGFEDCDDGEESAACDADCTVAVCGDGTTNVSAGEQCDTSGETASCDTDCSARVCGDGTVNTTAGEACDDGNIVPGDGCDPSCQFE